MTSNKAALDNSDVFKDNSLRMKNSSELEVDMAATPTSKPTEFGPGSEGVTFELCAGIVDKQVSLEQIAKEEVLEETGYVYYDIVLVCFARLTIQT